jgi:hypothetical protein
MMIRLGSLLFCATLGIGAALVSCGSSDSGGGAGGAGGGGVVGTGGGLVGTGGVLGTGGAVVGGTGGVGIGAGGGGGAGVGGTDAVLAIVPGDNTITGWVRDPSESKTKSKPAAIALDYKTAVDFIDGGADPFYTNLFKPDVFAWQNYKDTNLSEKPLDGSDAYLVKMYLLQMPSAAQATQLYDSLLDGTHSLYTSTLDPWDKTPAIGDAARIVNSGTEWWINCRKGAYYLEMFLSYAERTDTAGKQLAIAWATAVAAKM